MTPAAEKSFFITDHAVFDSTLTPVVAAAGASFPLPLPLPVPSAADLVNSMQRSGSRDYQYPSGTFLHHSPGNLPSASPRSVGILESSGAGIEIKEDQLLRWVDVFFDRLYYTLPVVDRYTLYKDLMARRQDTDQHFAAMLLSLCSVSLVQPINVKENESMGSRHELARQLLSKVASTRPWDFGQTPTLDDAIAGFFMFAALFGLNLHNAAWLRLREAIDYGKLLCLHKPESYEAFSAEERNQRLRLYLILCVTERLVVHHMFLLLQP